MKIFSVVAALSVCCLLSYGQDFNNYKTLLPQGIVPKDFTERSADKFASEITNLDNESGKSRRIKKKFYLESTFSLDDFLTSGNVLFNDEISMYASTVLAGILKPYPELQGKIRVYAVKSTVPNAFTTNNGIIFINLGLMARLENEAQLAFILGHEVAHYQKKHVINKYVTNVAIEKGDGDYKKLSMNDKDFAKSTYSKELETDADMGGTEIYLKTTYDKDSVYRVFDILMRSDFPMFWSTFDKKGFDSGLYEIPDSVNSDKTRIEDVLNEDYDDSESSHPNTRKRKTATLEKLKKGGKGDFYKVSKSWFDKTRNIARYELCRLYLLDHKFIDALALATSLQKENPSSAYLKQVVAKAMYGLAKESIGSKTPLKKDLWKGEANHLRLFLDRQSEYETCVMALRQLYACHEEYPDNKEISLMVDDLMRSFAREESSLSKNFRRTPTAEPIKNLKHPYTQHAFVNFKNTDEFFKRFDSQIELAKKKVVTKRSRKKQKRKKIEDLNKVVVVNPMYKMIDVRKKQKVRHIESEEKLLEINGKITHAARKLDLKADVLNVNTISSSQVATLQSNSILNDWIDEQMRSDGEYVSPIYNEITDMATQYKTDHFVWIGTMTLTHRSPVGKKVVFGIGALAFKAVAPWILPMAFTPKGKTLYFALAYNVRTQKIETVDIRQMNVRDNNLLMQSNIYYTLFKLKNYPL